MKVGFIGAGSMGSLLAGAFIESGALPPANVTVSSRTPSKAAALARRYPGLRAAGSNAETAENADVLFLCVKPGDFKDVLDDIAPVVTGRQIIISITSPVTIAQLEARLPGRIVKIIPSIVNAARSGAILVMWGSRVEPEDRAKLLELFGAISRPVEICEEDVRAASDLSSCGPAFFAYLLEEFINAAVRHSGIGPEKAALLATEMLLGLAKLLTEHGFTAQAIQARVSVPGGITAAAMEALKARVDGAFPALFQVTRAKFAEDLEKVRALLENAPEDKPGSSRGGANSV